MVIALDAVTPLINGRAFLFARVKEVAPADFMADFAVVIGLTLCASRDVVIH